MIKLGLRSRMLLERPHLLVAIAEEADRLGFESIWAPEHVALPLVIDSSPESGHATPMEADTHYLDQITLFSFIAARTKHIRLGTAVYVLPLRHPFIAARAVQTLDILSRGRVEFGVGAGWVTREFEAMGVDFFTRGKRLEESIEICRGLWSKKEFAYNGKIFDFPALQFEPKPSQDPLPKIHIGGESNVALRRAARMGDGWIGSSNSLETARPLIAKLHGYLRELGRPIEGFEVTVRSSTGETGDLNAWEDIGVTRLVVAPWPEQGKGLNEQHAAYDGLRRLAEKTRLSAPV
ncbi:MAG: Limonene 1,2-monooxygenase [Nitrosomonadaceae bacterium]|nr:Limonene 1,2-monooxygenase [Nitrosomonadaceae bacterium]